MIPACAVKVSITAKQKINIRDFIVPVVLGLFTISSNCQARRVSFFSRVWELLQPPNARGWKEGAVAQASKPAVSPTSKSAGLRNTASALQTKGHLAFGTRHMPGLEIRTTTRQFAMSSSTSPGLMPGKARGMTLLGARRVVMDGLPFFN